MAALAQGHARRHRLHARKLQQGRSDQLHPKLVRLGQRAVRPIDRRDRRHASGAARAAAVIEGGSAMITTNRRQLLVTTGLVAIGGAIPGGPGATWLDRKSTRLNSIHKCAS